MSDRKKPSHTAAKVARGVVFVAGDPVHAGLLPAGAADSIEEFALAAGAIRPWMVRLLAAPWYRRWVDKMVDWMGPGEMMRITLRKRFFDDEVRAAIEGGATQLLIVGAGFDTLGIRIARDHPDVCAVDVDTPATADRRRSAMDALGWRRPNHHIVGADLGRTKLEDALGTVSSWRLDGQTVAVAEGVLMYLRETEVRGFLQSLRDVTGAGTRLAFSYLSTDDAGRPYIGKMSRVSRWSLRLLGEELRWGIADGELPEFLEQSGYRVLGPPERFDLRRRYLVPAGVDRAVGRIERFVTAEVIVRSDVAGRTAPDDSESAAA